MWKSVGGARGARANVHVSLSVYLVRPPPDDAREMCARSLDFENSSAFATTEI